MTIETKAPEREMLRYRLSTLLACMTVVACGAFVWVRFIEPNIAGLSMDGTSLVVHMTDDFAQRYFANHPEFQEFAGDWFGGGGFPLIHDSHFVVSLTLPLALTVIVGLVGMATWLAIKRVRSMRSNAS